MFTTTQHEKCKSEMMEFKKKSLKPQTTQKNYLVQYGVSSPFLFVL